ncbi:MAG: UbiX family flavin prenyltransferase [Phycisphaerales bacterium]|nr:UbiX family flavin prenyltransferase [Phycisphaerales bacterium]
MTKRVVVGVTGASGAPYTIRLIQLLMEKGVEVHLCVSGLGKRLLFEESGVKKLNAEELGVSAFNSNLVLHNDRDLGAPIASGTFLHDGMIVLPCSSNTLGSIASGITSTLVQRAALVCLKERRKLVLGHRESPLSLIDIENIKRTTEAGAIVAPLSPGFYMNPVTISDVVDFMVGKLVDLLDIDHEMPVRWG